MENSAFFAQYKHPKWQKKRLEALDAAGFKCELCKATEATLHVHHKAYVKGRSVWDYELKELSVLCEDCHEEAHESKALILEVIGLLPSEMWGSAASLLVGWSAWAIEENLFPRSYDAHSEMHGQIATRLSFFEMDELDSIFESFSVEKTQDTVRAIRASLKPK